MLRSASTLRPLITLAILACLGCEPTSSAPCEPLAIELHSTDAGAADGIFDACSGDSLCGEALLHVECGQADENSRCHCEVDGMSITEVNGVYDGVGAQACEAVAERCSLSILAAMD